MSQWKFFATTKHYKEQMKIDLGSLQWTWEQILPLPGLSLAHNYHSNTASIAKCNPRSSKTLTWENKGTVKTVTGKSVGRDNSLSYFLYLPAWLQIKTAVSREVGQRISLKNCLCTEVDPEPSCLFRDMQVEAFAATTSPRPHTTNVE